jgi:error-prone DNA polymerase
MKPRLDPSTRTVLEPAPLRMGNGRGARLREPRRERPRFVELVARTAFSGITIEGIGPVEGRSLLDAEAAWPGAGLPEEVVARAALYGQDAVGIVDVDTVAGVVRAHAEGEELDVRVIVGTELWLDEGPLVLHAATPLGWGHLSEILTEAKRGLEKDDVDHRLERVLSRAPGLWALALPPFSAAGLDLLKEAFGERLSLGVAFHQIPEDDERLAFALAQGRRLDAPLVLTARPFLVDRSDKRLHDVITCIRQHLTLDTAGQRLLPNARSHMKDEDALVALARQRTHRDWDDRAIERAIARSRTIADACTFALGQLEYAFPAFREQLPLLPLEPVAGGTRDDVVLRALAFEGARWRYPEGIPAEVSAQLEHELALIQDIGVAAYFLTVKDIVDIARDKGILCQGRGSAANSAVCWCLGITAIDPVRMGLLFERFLSRERGEPPDIDVDFEHERREEVIQAIYEKYGRDHAAMVAEVISYRGRSAVREVGKACGLTEAITSRIADLMLHSSFREMTKGQLRRALIQSDLDPDDGRLARTLELSMRLQGHPRHLGIHVGGFVLTEAPITTLGPVEPARMEARTVLPWDKDDVDTLGLFKMDVLGLGMLTCIRKSIELLKKHRPEKFFQDLTLATIPPEDPAIYEALGRGDSLGVFQVESRAQMAMLPRLKPKTFYDLVVEVAIIRPGPIQGGMVHPYLRRRNGEEPIDYPHESLRPILERTLGVPLFQEQVMKLAIVGAGYSAGEADQLRRDMAAWRKTGRLERHRTRLLEGFMKNGIAREFGERLYEQIKGFGEYGFPESHAASFAILVYASSWLKTHHPAFFAAALINSLPMGFYAPAQIIADAQRHGVVVRPADVNHSDWDCTLDPLAPEPGFAIRLGLRLIKGLREELGRHIEAERGRGAFSDVSDLVRRLDLDKKARASLARAGALDTLASHRRAAVWTAMDKRPALLRALKDDDVGGALGPPSAAEILLLDYATTGVSIDDHPMMHLRRALPPSLGRVLDARAVQRAPHGTKARTVGLVIGRQRPGTADGTCFVTLEDEHGMVNVIVWGRDFDRWRQTVVTAQFLLVDGVIERQGLVVHMIAQRVQAVSASMGEEHGRQEELPFKSRDFH